MLMLIPFLKYFGLQLSTFRPLRKIHKFFGSIAVDRLHILLLER